MHFRDEAVLDGNRERLYAESNEAATRVERFGGRVAVGHRELDEPCHRSVLRVRQRLDDEPATEPVIAVCGRHVYSGVPQMDSAEVSALMRPASLKGIPR